VTSGWTPTPALVADARQMIAGALATTPEDRFERAAWGALLDVTGAELLTRRCAPAHVTASGIVLTPDGSKTCLVLHGKIRKWVQPGGHLEAGDESVHAAAAREVSEETGLTASPVGLPALLSRHGAPCAPGVVDWHLDVECVLVTPEVPPAVSEESVDVAWWPVTALPPDLAWGVAEAVTGAAALLREPAPTAAGAPSLD
jgi:8-oxo-dGTP pyrophosphatase MutT (NUDIX family)